MFHYDRGLKLTGIDLAIDICRRQPRAFVSHAHGDHMARHELALGTPATLRLYQLRLGDRPTRELPYRCPLDWGPLRLTTYPAGHCLGSAMLLAQSEQGSLLYTGDFKLSPSATAEAAELPHADVLVMESTFGDPRYRHPPRDRAIESLVDRVRDCFRRGATPVVRSYALGKSQEVTRLLSNEGFAVLQHPKVYEISRVYEACGVSLGNFGRLQRPAPAGHVLIVPPPHSPEPWIEPRRRYTTIAVTGWAGSGMPRRQARADYAIALSDHADYGELLEAIERVKPSEIYCTHGPREFADHLRTKGYNAYSLESSRRVAAR